MKSNLARNVKHVCSLLLVAFSLTSFAQDLIVKKDGNKIYCKIIQEDSTTLFYKSNKESSLVNATISKIDILNYYYATPVKNEMESKESDSIYSERNKLMHVGFFSGVAIPLGDYAYKEPKSKLYGLAGSGSMFSFSATVKLHNLIGISLLYSHQVNSFDHEKMTVFYNDHHNLNMNDKERVSSGTNWKVNSSLIGLYVTVPVKFLKNLYFETNILGGYSHCSTPGFVLSIVANDNGINSVTEEARQNSVSSYARTLFINCNFRYKIFRNLYVTLGTDYMSARPEFRDIAIYSRVYTYLYVDHTDLIQKIKIANCKVGITYTIEKKKA